LVSSGGFTTEYTDDINLLELSAGLVKRLPAKLLLQELFTTEDTEDTEDSRAGAVWVHRKDAGWQSFCYESFSPQRTRRTQRFFGLARFGFTAKTPGW
jgi:hypothetical protein